MAYKALYRSYRPKNFDEVIGQKHVIQTLKNAIIENRTSHAYVFSGLRGIGKTTIARILAKAVNCVHPVDGKPCNECASCKLINENSTTDIIELDAASNNGVDEIRSILDKVNYLPSELKKKVYIIDEVHMLSTAAFNALLKTLEEPPTYVMFILATTEPHKIPMTILSRCQRFDFKQLTIEELSENLQNICKKEGIKITDEAINSISVAADGGMRDALSILDQASVYAENEITIEDVNSITGNVSNQKLVELVKAFNEDDATKSVQIVNELLNMGKEVSRLTTCIIQFCRDILLYKSVDEITSSRYIFNTDDFIALAKETNNNRLFYYIDVLMDVQNKIRFTNSQKIYLEVGIMKIVNSATSDINLLSRIENIEAILSKEGVPTFTEISTPTSLETKINNLDNKIKKLSTAVDVEKYNSLKDQLESKIAALEESITQNNLLPLELKSRLEVIEANKQSKVETVELQQNDGDESARIDSLEAKLNENTNKNNEILTALLEEVEALKENTDGNDDENVLELMKKVEVIETKINNFANPVQTNDIDLKPLELRLEKLEKSLNETKAPTLFDLPKDPVDNKLEDITMQLNQIVSKITLCEEEVNKLKDTINTKQTTIFDTNDSPKANYISMEDLQIVNNHVTMIDAKTNIFLQNYEEMHKELLNLKNQLKENEPVSSLLYKENYDGTPEVDFSTTIECLADRINEVEKELKYKANNTIDSVIEEIKKDYNLLNDKVVPMDEKLSNVRAELNENITRLSDEIILLKNKIASFDALEAKETTQQIEEEKVVEVEKVEPVKEVAPKQETVNEELVSSAKEDLTQKIYDVKIVENILHEARTADCVAKRKHYLNEWPNIGDKLGASLAPIASSLSCGKLVANGEKKLLLVYPNAQLCNHLMTPANHEKAVDILKITFGEELDFMALPEDTWQEKRTEYHNQYHIGIMCPSLSPINNPQLHIVSVKAEKKLTDREIKLLNGKDFFGEED